MADKTQYSVRIESHLPPNLVLKSEVFDSLKKAAAWGLEKEHGSPNAIRVVIECRNGGPRIPHQEIEFSEIAGIRFPVRNTTEGDGPDDEDIETTVEYAEYVIGWRLKRGRGGIVPFKLYDRDFQTLAEDIGNSSPDDVV